MTPERRMQAILRGMFGTAPFYASLALRLPFTRSGEIETIAADGKSLFYSPEWVRTAPADQIRAAMAGCVIGCVLKHHTRRAERDKEIWDEAHRAVVRPILEADGMIAPDADRPSMDMSIEDAYEVLFRERPPSSDPGNDSSDPHGEGCMADGPGGAGGDEGEGSDEERGWDQAAQQAIQHARAEGKDPGALAEKLAEAHNGRLDYLALLRRFMAERGRADTTWQRPNRRFAHTGLYLPSPDSPQMGEVVFAVDTSGSVDEEELGTIFGEIRHAAAEVMPSSITVIQADAAVRSVESYHPLDLPEEIEVVGRGGTRFAPTFDAVDGTPACLIYYTDLWCDDFGPEPGYPVLWLVTAGGSNAEPPFGEVVRINGG